MGDFDLSLATPPFSVIFAFLGTEFFCAGLVFVTGLAMRFCGKMYDRMKKRTNRAVRGAR